MAQSLLLWYFSTMAARRVPIETVEFWRTKYGRELHADVAAVRDMPAFLRSGPHRLRFHDILLVTKGQGRFVLDGHVHAVEPGTVFFTAPHQVRRWDVKGLDGLCFFFLAPFVDDFLSDKAFVSRLPYFSGGSGALKLDARSYSRMKLRLAELVREFKSLRRDSERVLSAGLCDVLVRLSRLYQDQHPNERPANGNPVVAAFATMIGERARREHRVAPYARRLKVSANHLNALCRKHLGQSAKGVIATALALEARRALVASDSTIEAIGADLGFKDPAYFTRFFKRMNGRSPSSFRDGRRSL